MITIRAATTEDIPAVLALWSAATVEPSATDDADGVATLLGVDPESLLLAVDDDGALVGTVIAAWDGWRGTMYRLAVLPALRRQGIARPARRRRRATAPGEGSTPLPPHRRRRRSAGAGVLGRRRVRAAAGPAPLREDVRSPRRPTVGDLDGKVALITGGGTGIGASIAEVFAAVGAAVTVTGRRPDPLAEVAARITAAGGAALAVPADVTDLDAMQRAADETVERFGRLDIVVANAGIAPQMAPALDFSLEEWQLDRRHRPHRRVDHRQDDRPGAPRRGRRHDHRAGLGRGPRQHAAGSGPTRPRKPASPRSCRVLAAELRSDDIAVNELIPGPVRTPALDIFSGAGEAERARAGAGHRRVAQGARGRGAARPVPRHPPDRRHHRPGVQPRGPPALTAA